MSGIIARPPFWPAGARPGACARAAPAPVAASRLLVAFGRRRPRRSALGVRWSVVRGSVAAGRWPRRPRLCASPSVCGRRRRPVACAAPPPAASGGVPAAPPRPAVRVARLAAAGRAAGRACPARRGPGGPLPPRAPGRRARCVGAFGLWPGLWAVPWSFECGCVCYTGAL